MAVHFTKQQIDEIEQALTARSKKDSQFPGADLLEGTELIPIVQNGVNKVMTYSGLWNKVAADLREYVEESLDSKVDKEEGKELSANDFTDALLDKLNHIQAGAEVNVQSDWEAESGDAFILHKPDLSVYATVASVEDIEALIPSTASESNKLADKAFVNSSISTNTAEFKGTYDTLAELMTVAANLNDYGFVRGVDQLGNATFDRYKYTSSDTWLYEYTLNNTSFTAAQWAAINSGITESLVSKLDALPTNDSLTALLGGKVDKVSGKQLSTEDYTTAEKTKLGDLPTNGALNTALAGKVDKVEGKGLSTNDYTTAEKNKLAGLEYIVDAKTEFKTDQEFIYRKTNVSWDATTEILQSIHGKTLAWNQLVPIDKITVTSGTYNGLTITNNGDRTISISGTSTAAGNLSLASALDITAPVGRKVLISQPANASSDFYIRTLTGGAYTWGQVRDISTLQEKNISTLSLVYASGISVNVRIPLMIFDITALGLGDITKADFLALYPGYHAYNPGALISNDAESLETVGFNQWDEEWAYRRYWGNSNGKLTPESGQYSGICCKNPIPVQPNTTYYVKAPFTMISGGYFNIYTADADMNFISAVGSYTNNTFTTPANCAFITFSMSSTYGNTYNHDVCINISDPSRNGQYEPYKKSVCLLNIKTRTGKLNGQGASVVVFPNGMNCVGTSFDEANRTKGTKRRARVNLGDLNWSYDASGQIFYYNSFEDAKAPAVNSMFAKMICGVYKTVPDNQIASISKAISLGTTKQLCVNNPEYTDAASFKAAMDGVYLDYELAEPQEYVWDEPIANLIPTDRLGTERAIYPESDTPSAPFVADIQYGATTRDLVEAFKDRFEMLWNAVFNYPESE